MATTRKKPTAIKRKTTTVKASIDAEQRQLHFHYIKSSAFRTIHLDAVHGGLAPSGQIQMAMISERFPIPKETFALVKEDGSHEEQREQRMTRDGIVRDVEMNVIMRPSVARSVGQWLLDKAAEWEDLEQAVAPQNKKTATRKKTRTTKKTKRRLNGRK